VARNPHKPNDRRSAGVPDSREDSRGTFGRRALAIAVGVGLAGYLVLFFATPVTELPGESPFGEVWRRYHLPLGLILWPEALTSAWFGQPLRFALFERMGILLAAVALVAVASGAGWLAMRACHADEGLDRWESIVFSAAVGLNLVSLYTLLIGVAGLLDERWLFFTPAIGVLTTVAWQASRHGKAAGNEPVLGKPTARRSGSTRVDSDATSDTGGKWIAWLAVPFVAVIVFGAMLPPVDFDVREYHLQVPKEFYQNGRIEFLPHNVYGNMAMGSEMLSLLAMVMCGDWWYGALLGKTAAALSVPLTALALVAAGQRFFSRRAGAVAAVLYVSIPWIVRASTSGLVEGVAAFYWFMTVYAVLLWRSPGNVDDDAGNTPPRGLLAGFVAGSAVAIKYPAALFVLLPAIGWAIAGTATNRARRGLRPLAAMFLAATVACGPWFVKNWALAGNPTYPLLYSVFGGETWNAEKDARWNAAHRPADFRWQSLAASVADVAWRSPWLSPLVVPLAALAVLAPRHRRLLGWLLGYFGYVIAVWWLFTHRIDRFWIPALPVLALAAGVGCGWSNDRRWRMAWAGVLLAGLASNLLYTTSGPGGYNAYFVPLGVLRTDPARVNPDHLYLNANVPSGGVVLSVGDAQVFDLEMPVVYNTAFDDSWFELAAKDRTPEEFAAELATRGITHLYVHWGEIARYRSQGNYGYSEFIQPEVFARLAEDRVIERIRSRHDESERLISEVYRAVESIPTAGSLERGPRGR